MVGKTKNVFVFLSLW